VAADRRASKQAQDHAVASARSATGTDEDWIATTVRETFADNVYEQIRLAICRGDLPDGTELKQGELAVRFGVSRVPVREALRRLQAERLVSARPFYHYVVRALTPGQILELVDARAELEVLALTRALADPEELASRVTRARALAETMSDDDANWVSQDRNFHLLLLGEDSALATLVEDIRDWISRYVYSAGSNVDRRKRAGHEHRKILDALDAGDARALDAAVRLHIGGTRALLERYLNERDQALPLEAEATISSDSA
jgi:DNA-binding GntR family transcriptional regulator